MANLPKLMIVSWGAYPSTGGSSIIINNLTEAFEAEEVIVVSQAPVVLPEKPWSAFSKAKLHYLQAHPFGIRKGEKYTRWLKARQCVREIVTLIREEGVTHVLAVFPDEYYCYLAYSAARHVGCQFSVWLHNSYLENREGVLLRLAHWLQPRLFDIAEPIFVMSDGLNRELQKRYPDRKFTTLVHGFKVRPPKELTTPNADGKPIKYLYSGSLNDSCLDASLRMLRVLLTRAHTEIHIFSGNPGHFRQHGIEGEQVIFHHFLPVEDFIAQLDQYDIMLLPHGIDGLRSNFEYRTIFPTRTIPLLFSGKPILAHSPTGSFLTDFLEAHDCALVVTEKSEEQLQQAIDRLLEDKSLRAHLVKQGLRAAEQFRLENVGQRLRDTFFHAS